MATYKILYWREIPAQVRAEDDTEDVTLALPPKFLEQIDRLAVQRGAELEAKAAW